MRLAALLFLILVGALSRPAHADTPGIQIINFTADWCPTCHIFDPALHDAVDGMSHQPVEWISVDLTHARTGTQQQKDDMWSGFLNRMQSAGIEQIYHAYNQYPYTGYAVVIASDSKEPLVCMQGVMNSREITFRLRRALNEVQRRAPGRRVPEGSGCPEPFLSN